MSDIRCDKMQKMYAVIDTQELERLARIAGDKLLELWPGRNTGRELSFQRKSDGSLVTEADFASNEIITAGLKKMTPDDFVFSEEDANTVGFETAEASWIVDPLDGTEVYARGQNYFAIFIARKIGNVITEALMYYPALGLMYSASKGKGARLNGSAIQVSKNLSAKAGGIFVQGVPLAPHPLVCEAKRFPVGTTAFGALCRGEIDGVIVRFNSGTFYPWDFAPGMLLIAESGGRVTDQSGNEIIVTTSPVPCGALVASNGLLHDTVLQFVPR